MPKTLGQAARTIDKAVDIWSTKPHPAIVLSDVWKAGIMFFSSF